MYCKYYGREVMPYDNYCMSCGKRIKRKLAVYRPFGVIGETKKCETCHHSIPKYAYYCPNCRGIKKRKQNSYKIIFETIINVILFI